MSAAVAAEHAGRRRADPSPWVRMTRPPADTDKERHAASPRTKLLGAFGIVVLLGA